MRVLITVIIMHVYSCNYTCMDVFQYTDKKGKYFPANPNQVEINSCVCVCICATWLDHLMNGIKSVISSHKNHKLSGLQQDHDCPIILLLLTV